MSEREWPGESGSPIELHRFEGGRRATNPQILRPVLAAIAILPFTGLTKAQDMPVYYDYVEDGVLKGGRILVDRSNPDHRRALGLEALGRVAGPVWPVTTVIDNGPTTNRVDIVMLGDGYTAGETTTYAGHVNAVLTPFFSEEPFAAYSRYFNVHRVDVVSNESGVDELDLGIFKDTALDMEYGCFNIDRLLCIAIGKAEDAAASAPAVDQIIALANSTRYGGAGYPFLVTMAGDNASAVEIGLHEFGHSFAGLADEYDYGDGATYVGSDPPDPNVSIHTAATQLAQSLKWYRWMGLPNVDTFQGAYYNQFGIYRPTTNSKMRSLNRPFEEVNIEQFVISIYEIVSPIDDATPSSPVPLPYATEFFVTPLQPLDHSLDIQWSIDGVPVIGADSSTFAPLDFCPAPGLHDVSVAVIDNTPRVRDANARALWMTDTRQWQIDISQECESPPPPDIAWNTDPLGPSRSTRSLGLGMEAPVTADGTPAKSAIKVAMINLQDPVPPNLPQFPPPDFSSFEVGTCGDPSGCARWVGKPDMFLESQDSPATGNYRASRLQCTPYYTDWVAETAGGVIAVVGAEIAPSSEYSVQTYGAACQGWESGCANVSAPVQVFTRRSCDVEAPFCPPTCGAETGGQPNVTDVAQLVNKFKNVTGALSKAIAQLQPNLPELNADINALDVVAVVDAVKQKAYAFSGPCPCPSTVPCGVTACSSVTPCVTAYGAGSTCVKTCVGGANAGDPCINDTHCPGSTCGAGFCRDRCGRCSP